MSPNAFRVLRSPHGPGLTSRRLSRVCLFIGLSGLTSMLFLAGWADTQPVSGAGDPFATALLAALLTVSAVFAVAWLWPLPARVKAGDGR